MKIDNEIKRVVLEAEQKATGLLSKNIDKLDLLAEALLDKEILDGHEIDKILQMDEGKAVEKQADKKSNPDGEDKNG